MKFPMNRQLTEIVIEIMAKRSIRASSHIVKGGEIHILNELLFKNTINGFVETLFLVDLCCSVDVVYCVFEFGFFV